MQQSPERFIEYHDKGITGLANVGNTCYVNSCIQCLSHTYELNDFLSLGTYQNRLNRKPDSVLLVEWDNLRKMMWKQNCNIAPWGFVKAVQKVSSHKGQPMFTGYSQNDVQEFLLFLIDSFHNSISREVDMKVSGHVDNDRDVMAKSCYAMMKDMFEKDYSEIVSMFYGIHVSAIMKAGTDQVLSVRPEPFFVLSLPLPPKQGPEVTLIECMDGFCNKERMEGENAWFNDKTNQKEDIDKGMLFWSFPEVLIVHLKRWVYTGNKDKRLVSCDLECIDLTPYVKGYNPESYKYQLYGVCNHQGGALGGHYTANVRTANGDWMCFNDMSVKPVEESKVITPAAYCLFFRKIK